MIPPAPPAGTLRDWLDRRAEETPQRPAYLFTDGAPGLTWAELRDGARAVATGLARRGIAPGQSVAVMLPNGRAALLGVFGAVYGGFRATMINLAAGPDAMAYALEHSEARAVFADAERRALLATLPGTSPEPLDAETLDAETLAADTGAGLPETAAPAAGDDALLMYTSGTTGRPKGVLHSHASLLAGGWTTTIAHRLTSADRGLCVLPICHINALCVSVAGTLVSGGTLALAPRFSASRFWADMARFQATWASLVPTAISHLLHDGHEPDAGTRARVRFIRSASAPLAPETQRGFEARFGMPIIETMGLTETAAQILSNPLPPATRKIGSPGIAFGCEVAILEPDHRPLPAGRIGEIAVRGPNVMKGYFRDAQATAKALTPEGWLLTGDLGRIDRDGYVFVTGRLKELIIKGGENIAPREIDEALYGHPDVVEAAAFALPHPGYGETVAAAVKLREGARAGAEDLRATCVEHVGAFKAPDKIYILPELPRGPSGKIQRLRLAEILAAEAGN